MSFENARGFDVQVCLNNLEISHFPITSHTFEASQHVVAPYLKKRLSLSEPVPNILWLEFLLTHQPLSAMFQPQKSKLLSWIMSPPASYA